MCVCEKELGFDELEDDGTFPMQSFHRGALRAGYQQFHLGYRLLPYSIIVLLIVGLELMLNLSPVPLLLCVSY